MKDLILIVLTIICTQLYNWYMRKKNRLDEIEKHINSINNAIEKCEIEKSVKNYSKYRDSYYSNTTEYNEAINKDSKK